MRKRRFYDTLQIEPDRPAGNVFHVIYDLFLGCELVAAVDLRVAGQARRDDQPVGKADDVLFKLLVKVFPLRARADKAHLALQNVPELRQLVQPRLAQERAEACAAVVAALGPFWPVLFRIHAHGAELADQKRLAVFPEALLPVDWPAWGIQRDDRGDDPHGDGQHDQREQCKGKIKAALEDQIAPARLYLRKRDVYRARFIGCFRDRRGKCCRHAASSPSFSFSRFQPLCAFRITDRAIRSLRKTLPRRFRSFAEYATQ